MNIGIIGSRGIPGNYGGFETFAERLGLGLVRKEHTVTVYCSSALSRTNAKFYKGIRRVIIPCIPLKSLDKISSSFIACFHSVWADYDIIFFLGVSPVLFAWLPMMFGKKTVINIDGLEWKRKKWNRIASSYLKLSESLSGRLCHEVVTDSRVIKKYFKNEYGKDSTFIAYGADIQTFEDDIVLEKYGLKKNEYLLQVCRVEPENNSHIIIREYCQSEADMPLVIVGDSPYGQQYIEELKRMADNRVKFLGSIYGYDYDVIRSNPYCYIHAHEVGGTNPALLESLAAGNCVIVLDVLYNLEVIGDAGLSFSKAEGSLRQSLGQVLGNPQLVSEMRKKAVERIKDRYTWDKIIEKYEGLFHRMLQH